MLYIAEEQHRNEEVVAVSQGHGQNPGGPLFYRTLCPHRCDLDQRRRQVGRHAVNQWIVTHPLGHASTAITERAYLAAPEIIDDHTDALW